MGAMTIGDFSRATKLTAKALRFYHETGLLTPSSVDPHNGYRRYGPEQVADAQVIRSLRALDVPVDVVHEVLATPDVAARASLVRSHLDRMEQRLAETESAVARLRGLLADESAPVDVTYRSVPETLVVAIRATIDLADLGRWFRRSVAGLAAVEESGAVTPVGPRGSVWSTELFLDERGPAALFMPVDEHAVGAALPAGASVLRLPPVDLAVATSRGSDDDVVRVYGALGEHVARRELSVDGPVREIYVEGLPGLDEHTVTEIGWPIFRISR
ncbi:MerR family transcriptional regulator [Georgenia wangjunii]|uniref:MerR family transcriptional regulator n=1 Tax=Georgenia wangjunii TaxID=3117730 RepID=UPI002F261237